MKLRSLKIEDFRGIESLDLDFTDDLGRVRDLTVIVGPNGSGKTSILDAIWFGLLGQMGYRLLRRGFRYEPEYVVTRGRNHAAVHYEIEISDAEYALIDSWRGELDEETRSSYPTMPNTQQVRIEWTYPAQPGYQERKKPGGYRLIPDTGWLLLQGKTFASKRKYMSAKLRLDPGDLDKIGGIYFFEQERHIVSEPVQDAETLPESDEPDSDTGVNGFLSLRKDVDIRQALINFGLKDKVRNYNKEESWYYITQDGFNYICAPHQMGEVIARRPDGEYDIEFKDGDGHTYGFDGLSSGERSVLNFMVQYLYKRMKNSIVLIDEIELHLHPTWQRRLVENLLRLEDGNQYIITTHSPVVAMGVDPDYLIELGDLDEGPAPEEDADMEGEWVNS